MEENGISLFQGPGGLQINTDRTPQEEEEAEEDQKRRNEELHDLITNAFDDLMEDDEDNNDLSVLNSSQQTHDDAAEGRLLPANYLSLDGGGGDNSLVSQHYTHCFQKSPFEEKTDYGSREQLEVLYEVRLREVQRLMEQLQNFKEQATEEKDQLYRRLALAQAEAERASLQHTNCKNKLEASNAKVVALEKDQQAARLNLSNMEGLNLKLTGELEAAQMSVKDLEKRISLMEHGNGMLTDNFLRMIHQKHERELLTLKVQVDAVSLKFSAKDHECDELQKQLKELSQRHQSKAEGQKHMDENEELKKKVNKLQIELDSVRGDLQHFEEIAQLGLLGSEGSNSFNMNLKSNPSNDLNVKLRDELERCLAGLKMKREEIKRLQNQLDNRNEVIAKLREQEALYLAQAGNLQKDAEHLMDQLNKYQVAESGQQSDDKLQALEEEKARLEQELVALRQQSVEEKLKAIDQHSEEYVQWHDKVVARVRQEANQQIQVLNADFRVKLEQVEKECLEVKQLYIEVSNSKDKLMASLEKEREANKQLAAEAEAKLRQVEETSSEAENLRQSLEVEKEKVRDLELELQRSIVDKANEDASSQCKQSNPSGAPNQEEISEVVARLQAEHEEHLEQVKHESVQCLANELSALEARHRQQLEQAEEEYARNLASFRSLIDNKTQEVEVLKKAMLKERDKLRAERENLQAEELRACKKEMDALEERLQSCEKEWQAKLAAQSDEWRAKLASYQRDVESERDKMAQALAGWAEELHALQKQYHESELKVVELHNKYQAAKKTARHYKQWADGKEKHLEQEWRRICVAFENALEALHMKAEAALAHSGEDNTIVKQLDTQIQELQNKVIECTPRSGVLFLAL